MKSMETSQSSLELKGDNLMKTGLVFDIKKYSIHDGPGIRTTVFLKGCPLSCWWCHNPESQSSLPAIFYRPERCIGCGICIESCPRQALELTRTGVKTDLSKCTACGICADRCPSGARELVGTEMTVEEVVAEIKKDLLFYDQSGGGVTFSGGEPLLQPEFLIALLQECGKFEFHRAVDTSGFAPLSVLLEVARYTDLFLYDVKMMDSEKHKKYTGVGNELILSNLRALAESGAAINVRIPIIPGINDDDENIEQTGLFVASLPNVCRVNILPYHSAGRSKYEKWGREYLLPEVMPPTENAMQHIAKTLSQYGLDVKIGG